MSLELWNRLSRPPASALKAIAAGRLRGKSDINPQWRMLCMTEQFGPCGVGWKYTIDRLWTEPGTAQAVFAFALVSVYIKSNGEWSEPIPGIGGHQLIQEETNGLHNNDEAFKMATTDALSVAMKALGVAAEIYLGNWDGSKYRDARPEQPPQGNRQKTVAAAAFSAAAERDIAAAAAAERDIAAADKWPALCDLADRLKASSFSADVLSELTGTLVQRMFDKLTTQLETETSGETIDKMEKLVGAYFDDTRKKVAIGLIQARRWELAKAAEPV